MRLLLILAHWNIHFLLLLRRRIGTWLLLTNARVFDITVLVLKEDLLHLVLPIIIAEECDRVWDPIVLHLV